MGARVRTDLPAAVREDADRGQRGTGRSSRRCCATGRTASPVPGSGPSWKDSASMVLTMMLAGQDTTSSLIAWTLHHLAGDPDTQERVRAEAATVLREFGPPADPAALRGLRHTDAAIQESLRLRPVVPVMGFRPTRHTVLHGTGYDLSLPAGQSILLLLSHGARAVPDPDEFRPRRWFGTMTAQPFFPFGAGPRFCPGHNLALLEATLVVGLACRDFQLAPDGGKVGEKLAFPTGLRLRPQLRPGTAGATRR
ncbi:cytochrome P450 [Catenuloplanes indicus]|nr:cytochrome P450 [Catenuloplanes indicus]